MDTLRMKRWVAPLALAMGLSIAAFVPKPAQAQDDARVRVLVDIGDVVLRDGRPYYGYGGYRDADRLIVGRDRYGRPIYYRVVDRRDWRGRDRYDDDRYRYVHRYRYPAYGYDDRYAPGISTARRVKCNKHGNCEVSYYDAHYDRRRWRDR